MVAHGVAYKTNQGAQAPSGEYGASSCTGARAQAYSMNAAAIDSGSGFVSLIIGSIGTSAKRLTVRCDW